MLMQPLQDFREIVEKVVQVLSCEETFEQRLENNLILSLSDYLSSCLALTTREQGEELLDCSLSLWNQLVERYSRISKGNENAPCILIKFLHVAADAICVALSSLSGMSGNFDIDWFHVSNQFLALGMMYLEMNLLELSKTCLERCLEIINTNEDYCISQDKEQQIANMTFDAFLGLAKVAWLEGDQISLLRNFEQIGHLSVDKKRIEYVAKVEYNAALCYLNQSQVDIAIPILKNALDMLSKHNLCEESYCLLASNMLRMLAYGYLCKNDFQQVEKYIEQAEKLFHSPLSTCLKIRYFCQYGPKDESRIIELVNQLVSDPRTQIDSLDEAFQLLKTSKKHLPTLLFAYKSWKDTSEESDRIQQFHASLRTVEIELLLDRQITKTVSELCDKTIEILSLNQEAYENRIGNLWKQFIETLAFRISITELEDRKQVAETVVQTLGVLEPLWSTNDSSSLFSVISSSLILVYSGIVPLSLLCLFSSDEEDKQLWIRHTKELTEKLLGLEPESVIGSLSWILVTGNFQQKGPFINYEFHTIAACIVRSCCEWKQGNMTNSVAILVKILSITFENQAAQLVISEQMQKFAILSFLLVIAFMELNFEDLVASQMNMDDWTQLYQIGMHLWKARNIKVFSEMEETEKLLIWESFLGIIWKMGQVLHKGQRFIDASKCFQCFRVIAAEKDENDMLAVLQSSLIELTCLLMSDDTTFLNHAAELLAQIKCQMEICRDHILLKSEMEKYQCAYLLCKACYLVRTSNSRELEKLVEDASDLPYTHFQEMLAKLRGFLT